MNKFLLTLSFLISLICLTSQSWALPSCPSIGIKHNCYGSKTFSNGDIYVGEYENNLMHGRGTYIFHNGDKYIGGLRNGDFNGQGTLTFGLKSKWAGDKYIGGYKDDQRHGQGNYTHANGDEYIGGWKDGTKHGQGTLTWKKSGNKYIGEWKNDNMHGQGIKTYASGTIEEGIWENDKFMYAKKPISSPNSIIEGYKDFCSEIGFTPGTEKFGDCVVEVMKKG